MDQKYDHKKIEFKWQNKWRKEGLYATKEDKNSPKYYILDMFPYPSGAGLHVGHPKGYIATDIFARMKMMQGFNVLHPMGWDAFGLPAENYAIKNKTHPKISTDKNIKTFKLQLEKLGFSYDWSREINTTDPKFYKWTQWIFLQMFKKGLAYESYEPIIWCPSCQTGLANEDLEDGKCERCGSEIEKKAMRQWVLKITDYADQMLEDLEELPAWDESIKEMQRNWIGRSEGAELDFQINNEKIKIFTTRPDTLFGATYFVLAPEHPLLQKQKAKIKNYSEVEAYIKKAQKKSDLERTDLAKEKTGVKLEGLEAINPVNGEKLSVFIADYVMLGYGTGAIMAVPAHDERDWEFAKKYDLPIKEVVKDIEAKNQKLPARNDWTGEAGGKIKNQNDDLKLKIECFTGNGIAINSGFLDDLETSEAKEKMITWLEEKNIGEKKFNYKLKDWVFSRQRYWGEPIPLVYCELCKKKIAEAIKKEKIDLYKIKQEGISNFQFPISNQKYNLGELLNPGWIVDNDLPVALPNVENYKPTGTGESPLANISEWVNTVCPKCGASGKRETNTMPQWAGSSWYFLRFVDPDNDNFLVSKEKEKYWSPVDFYVGGAEHATRHLIYARFWHKFLYDIGVVNYKEPFTRLQHVGLIMAEDGRKMSKRWGNVINPDEIVEKYGADAMRIYEMFMGPFSQACAWSTNGLIGARKFLDKIYFLRQKINSEPKDIKEIENIMHKTIKKVGEDIQEFKLNTAVSAMMILVNKLNEQEKISKNNFENLLKILSPFAPHLSEELWEELGNKQSIFKEVWPEFNKDLIKDEIINLVIQVNGKLRATIEVPVDISEKEAIELAKNNEKIQNWIKDKKIVKAIFVKGRLVNIVLR